MGGGPLIGFGRGWRNPSASSGQVLLLPLEKVKRGGPSFGSAVTLVGRGGRTTGRPLTLTLSPRRGIKAGTPTMEVTTRGGAEGRWGARRTGGSGTLPPFGKLRAGSTPEGTRVARKTGGAGTLPPLGKLRAGSTKIGVGSATGAGPRLHAAWATRRSLGHTTQPGPHLHERVGAARDEDWSPARDAGMTEGRVAAGQSRMRIRELSTIQS